MAARRWLRHLQADGFEQAVVHAGIQALARTSGWALAV
jgi:type II secretory pathway component PulL